MARPRRGGGFRPPELRGTLGTLLNTALQQAGVVRDALERGAREGRSRLDEVRSNRRRQDALAELGEIVLDLVRRGEIDLGELPEAADVIRALDELDDEGHEDPIARPASRQRFDERGRDREDRDDGTVSSKTWSPSPRRGASRDTSVWRPPVEAASNEDEPAAPPASKRPLMPPNPHKKGGIAFDDDDDLADYMHPDDVPAKPTDGDS